MKTIVICSRAVLLSAMPLMVLTCISCEHALAQQSQATPSEKKQSAEFEVIQQGLKPIISQSHLAREEIFRYLRSKNIGDVTRPNYPADSLLSWARGRYYSEPDLVTDPKTLYRLAYEDLLIAKELLASKDERQRRRGLRLVASSERRAPRMMEDVQLSALYQKAFILPHLDVAYVEDWQDLGCQYLLMSACGSFGAVQDTKSLEIICQILINTQSPNVSDQFRVRLAELYAQQSKYKDAIELLNGIRTADMQGAKDRIKDFEEKLSEENASKEKGSQN